MRHLLFFLLFVAQVAAGNCQAQTLMHTLRIQALASDSVNISSRRIAVDKGIASFGRSVENQRIRIDDKTRGLADVFIWISIPFTEKTKAEHLMVLANGNYAPHALIAAVDDHLSLVAVDRVADNPRVVYRERAAEGDRARKRVYILDKVTDRPVKIESTIYPWLEAYVFVQKETSCNLTDRLGDCVFMIPSDATGEYCDVNFWHPFVKEWNVECNVELDSKEPGRVRVSVAQLVSKNTQLKLTAIAVGHK